jgi:hypothetical protein
VDPQLIGAAGIGVVAGLVLLVRGFGAYRAAATITDTSPSRIASIAVGEVLVSGVVEPAELMLVSPLQSAPCVYYRSRISETSGDDSSEVFRDEAAVGFRLRDDSGDLRVFPRGARFDVPARFEERTGSLGETPPGLNLRTGSTYGAGNDAAAQIAELLRVKPAAGSLALDGGRWEGFAFGMLGVTTRPRRYSEARIEPGDVITVVGRAMPFDQLADPSGADVIEPGLPTLDDPEIAADLAAARAAGTLADDAEEAWGNAAIPGFGIGRPVREPELHEEAAERTFEIAGDALILAASPDVGLTIALGSPTVAAGRREREFLTGLLGAVLAIGSAVALAAMLGGGLGG